MNGCDPDDRDVASDRKERRVTTNSAAELFLETFRLNGVEYFFNSPGSEYAPFWELFSRGDSETAHAEIEFVGCRHESLAVHMAMGEALVSGNPQVVALHVNSGTLNAGMALHSAYQGDIPLVVLMSHAGTHENELFGGTPGSHYFQYSAPGGAENFFHRYVKWIGRPANRENVPEYISRAFRIARASPPGPVVLNISRELLFDSAAQERTISREAVPTPPTPGDVDAEELVSILEEASNPLLVVSDVGKGRGVQSDLVTLAEKLACPVVENPKRYNCFPTDHPLWLGAEQSLEHCLSMDVDVVLVLGSAAPWYPPAGNAPDALTILVDTDPVQSQFDYWNYPVDRLVDGDPATTVADLTDRLDGESPDRPVDWAGEHDALVSRWEDRALTGCDSAPIDPYWLCLVLDRELPSDAILVNETITHWQQITNLIGSQMRVHLPAKTGVGADLGCGLGIALGAKLARPDRTVVSLIGDGSFNYNPVPAALGAAQEHDLPTLTVIFDNEGYQSQERSHRSYFADRTDSSAGSFPGTNIQPPPDYARAVEAWSGYGATVRDPENLESAIEDALEAVEAGNQAILDVIVAADPPPIEADT